MAPRGGTRRLIRSFLPAFEVYFSHQRTVFYEVLTIDPRRAAMRAATEPRPRLGTPGRNEEIRDGRIILGQCAKRMSVWDGGKARCWPALRLGDRVFRPGANRHSPTHYAGQPHAKSRGPDMAFLEYRYFVGRSVKGCPTAVKIASDFGPRR